MAIVDDTIAEMTDCNTVLDSALVYINSVPAQTQAAIDKALAGGATAAQLEPFVQLAADQKAKSDAVKAALVVNTPSA